MIMDTVILKNIMLPDSTAADIAVKAGKIAAVTVAAGHGENPDAGMRDAAEDVVGEDVAPEANAEVIDCSGKAVLPGLVNMHTHAAMSMMRGLEEDVLFHKWLDRIWDVESKIDAEYVYWATKVACIEMLRTGTTLYNNHYWFSDVAHRAASEMGIRPVESYVFLDKFNAAEAQRQKEQCEKMYSKSLDWGDDAHFTVGIHSIYSVGEQTMVWAADFARRHGLKIHIHLSETEKEVNDCIKEHGVSPVEYLDRLGILGPDLIAAHTLWLSDNDIDLLGAHHVNCVHNINSNLKLASGYRFRYNELRDAGANVCIGTDGCASSNNLDILEALKTAAMVQKAWRKDPSAMPLDELVPIATANGARALGINTGLIEVGRDADLLIIDTDNTFFLSPAPLLANLVYSAHSDCIGSVMCRGRFVMRDRKIEGEKEILAEAGDVLRRMKF